MLSPHSIGSTGWLGRADFEGSQMRTSPVVVRAARRKPKHRSRRSRPWGGHQITARPAAAPLATQMHSRWDGDGVGGPAPRCGARAAPAALVAFEPRFTSTSEATDGLVVSTRGASTTAGRRGGREAHRVCEASSHTTPGQQFVPSPLSRTPDEVITCTPLGIGGRLIEIDGVWALD